MQTFIRTSYYTILHAKSTRFHLNSAHRNGFRHPHISLETGRSFSTSAHLNDIMHHSSNWVIKSTTGIQLWQCWRSCRNWMPSVDYMTQVKLWCVLPNKCALVHNGCPDSNPMKIEMVTKTIAICRNRMKRCRFGVQKGVLHLFAHRIDYFSFDFGISQLIPSPFHCVWIGAAIMNYVHT